MTVIPANTGSHGKLILIFYYRIQEVGFKGSSKIISNGIIARSGHFNGKELCIFKDDSGFLKGPYFDTNYMGQLVFNRKGDKLALGFAAGARAFNIDYTKGIPRDNDEPSFNGNANGRLLPSVEAGIFCYTSRPYLRLSASDFFPSDYCDRDLQQKSDGRMHFNLIGKYVFNSNTHLKFKPSFFLKQVIGSPISVDVSANFFIYETLNLGVNYRWDNSVAAIIGFQNCPKLNVEYAFDYSISDLNGYNSGSHEIFLRYQWISRDNKLKSPRFF